MTWVWKSIVAMTLSMMDYALPSLTPASFILLLLQASSSWFLPLSFIQLPSSSFLPHPALSHSRFLSHSTHRSKVLHFCDVSQIMKPNGTHDLIKLTATRGEWCCPHSADDENRGHKEWGHLPEATEPWKGRGKMAACVGFPLNFISHRDSNTKTCPAFSCIRNKTLLHVQGPQRIAAVS